VNYDYLGKKNKNGLLDLPEVEDEPVKMLKARSYPSASPDDEQGLDLSRWDGTHFREEPPLS